MHEVLVNHLGALSLPRKRVVRLTDRPDMTLDVYCGRKTTIQQQQQQLMHIFNGLVLFVQSFKIDCLKTVGGADYTNWLLYIEA